MTTILRVQAREVLDSRGNPTVEVELSSRQGETLAMVPSGASTGSHEALELRDGGRRFFGKGVLTAVANVNTTLSRALAGQDVGSQAELDAALNEADGTGDKSSLGANALLGVSLAFCRLQAQEGGKPLYAHLASLAGGKGTLLPLPQMNLLNGGKHAGFANDIQEHMIVPRGKTFSRSLEMGAEVYQLLGHTLRERFGPQAAHLADEGGFAPVELKDTRSRLELLSKVVGELGYGKEVGFALDAAANEFCSKGAYVLGTRTFSSGELADFYADLARTFPLVSLEDGLAEDDWEGWSSLTKALGGSIQVVGDDLLATNPARLRIALERKACNALLLKVNQIGTVTEALQAAAAAREGGWRVIVSHRSGETEDAFIADLAVGMDAGQCKFGAPARGERTAKYNRLLRIEQVLGKEAVFRQQFGGGAFS